MTTFVNVNKFAVQLKRTQHPDFASLDFWAIVAMRNALEHPDPEAPEVWIPAAVIWVSMLGPEMYSWDKEFSYGYVHRKFLPIRDA